MLNSFLIAWKVLTLFFVNHWLVLVVKVWQISINLLKLPDKNLVIRINH
jgi:hypothetical protein